MWRRAASVKMQITGRGGYYISGYLVLVSALKYFHEYKRNVMKIWMSDKTAAEEERTYFSGCHIVGKLARVFHIL